MNTNQVFFCANIFLVKQSVETSRLSPLIQPSYDFLLLIESLQIMNGENKSPPINSNHSTAPEIFRNPSSTWEPDYLHERALKHDQRCLYEWTWEKSHVSFATLSKRVFTNFIDHEFDKYNLNSPSLQTDFKIHDGTKHPSTKSTMTDINKQLSLHSIAPDFGMTRALIDADNFKNRIQRARSRKFSTIFLQSQLQNHRITRVLPSETYAAEHQRTSSTCPKQDVKTSYRTPCRRNILNFIISCRTS